VRLDDATGRDLYFEQRDRELETFVDPETGRLLERLSHTIDCPLCGSSSYQPLFTKQGFDIVRCSDCTLVYVNPQLDEQIVLDEYRTAETLDLWFDVLTSERQQELDRAKFSEILDLLEPLRGGGRILDLGCSTGLFLHLAETRGWSGLGIELSPKARGYAQDEYGLDVLAEPLESSELEAESFDAVTLLSVLEHANNPRQILLDCVHVLRPGGAFYVVVPNVESLACRVLRAHARTFDGRNHLTYFSPGTLAAMLESVGLDVRRTTTKVSSLEPVLRYLAFGDPYGSEELRDPLFDWAADRRTELEEAIEGLGLGYKLHCLAVKRTGSERTG
jgi:2-polyprenyl-3-methyl-5-hydroxy-6-metoxy-1,4-benzoquinol methylase